MENNDLISRQALLEAYDREHEGAPGMARRLIEDAPAVDAVPVVHGRWVRTVVYEEDFGYIDQSHCSQCGQWEHAYGNYCLECGAKMGGEKE